MPTYDDRLFAPPAAVLEARLRNPQSGTIVPVVSLLIDTGADVTLLPLRLLEESWRDAPDGFTSSLQVSMHVADAFGSALDA